MRMLECQHKPTILLVTLELMLQSQYLFLCLCQNARSLGEPRCGDTLEWNRPSVASRQDANMKEEHLHTEHIHNQTLVHIAVNVRLDGSTLTILAAFKAQSPEESCYVDEQGVIGDVSPDAISGVRYIYSVSCTS